MIGQYPLSFYSLESTEINQNICGDYRHLAYGQHGQRSDPGRDPFLPFEVNATLKMTPFHKNIYHFLTIMDSNFKMNSIIANYRLIRQTVQHLTLRSVKKVQSAFER